MPRLSLRVKLLASFILVLIPVLGLLLYGYREDNERRTHTVLDDQMQTAQAIALLVDASFDEAFALAWALTYDPIVQSLDPSQIDPHLEQVASRYPQYESVGVQNRAGDNVGISVPFPPGASRERVAVDRPYFQQVMASGEPVVSGLLISRRTSRPTVILAVPLNDSIGSPSGIVFVTLYMEAWAQRLTDVALKSGQNMLFVDKVGMAAFHTALQDIAWEQRDLRGFEPVASALAGMPSEVRHYESPLVGGDRMGAFTPSPKYGWVVGVTIGEDEALAPVQATLRSQLIAFGGVAILSLALVLLLSYLLLQPIQRLADHALAVARGQLQHRVSVKTGDELEDLGNSVNYMAGQLEARDAENARLARLKDEFLSVAAHELKTPVTSIKGYAQLLLRREQEGVSTEGVRALEAVNRGADRIGRLINELLEISRIQTGRLELNPTKFDLSELACEVVERTKLTTDKHRLLCHTPGPILVDADRDRIEQVFNSLLDNARKFSPLGGDIDVTVRPSPGRIGGEAVVSVRDYGVGIPKERQSHIFERFYRAHLATPYDYGGMGIALHISREMVIRNGGRMWFESEEEKGSTFYFSLPTAGTGETG